MNRFGEGLCRGSAADLLRHLLHRASQRLVDGRGDLHEWLELGHDVPQLALAHVEREDQLLDLRLEVRDLLAMIAGRLPELVALLRQRAPQA
ncbi:MAG TPA: hypothetical protein VGJ56_08730 [Reyranella sp.]